MAARTEEGIPMTVDLSPQVAALIRQRLASGAYRTADEVIREALRVLDEQERLDELRAKLQVGLDQLERGEVVPFTPEWRADRLEVARRRAEAGDKPNPDVCP
jgi:antitoxin ParD1/3/4